MQEQQPPKSSVLSPSTSPLLAGLLGGATSTVLLYPLDLIKVRFQVNEDPVVEKKTLSSVTAGSNLQRPSIIRTLRLVIRHEGFLGLYQGMTPAILGSAVSWGGYFFIYEEIKQQLRKRNSSGGGSETRKSLRLGPLENFVAACASGVIMVSITNPVWLIKTRLQLQLRPTVEQKQEKHAKNKAPYRGMLHAFRTIVKEEGVLALYKGALPALMLTSHGGVQFVSYEFLKERFGNYQRALRGGAEKGDVGVMERLQLSMGYLTMGATSKIIASTVTYPFQVIKSRLQQRSEAVELTLSGEVRVIKREYKGVIDCSVRIWKREGVLGFFKGTIANALRVAPSAAITFVVYESVMDFLS